VGEIVYKVVCDWLYYYFREFSCVQAMLRLVTSKINVTAVNVCESELLLGNLTSLRITHRIYLMAANGRNHVYNESNISD
jgi:hypothetical protein